MDRLLVILTNLWAMLGMMSPYLLLGFLVAGVLSVILSPEGIERHLGGRGLLPVLKAAAFGVPLPLCSCGVIPVAASLRRHGASRGATAAFLMSTPQTGVDSILVTFSLLGGVYAVFRPIMALISGVVCGGLVTALTGDGTGRTAPPCRDACCDPNAPKRNRFLQALTYGFDTLPRDIGRSLLAGLLAAALISALVPEDYFAPYLGGGVTAMAAMMLLGLPVYVCATASVPVAAMLIRSGVSPGAALAFLITGPATNAATLVTIWKVLGRRTALIYLLTIMASAMGGGLLLDQLVSRQAVLGAQVHVHQAAPTVLHSAAAVALLGVLAAAVVRGVPRQAAGAEAAGEPALRLRIRGMTCDHCVRSVRSALEGCAGVERATVDLQSGLAAVTGQDVDYNVLRRAVEKVGYGAEPADAGTDTDPASGRHGA